ncbi:MAG: tetratricopeptide repeat protein [Candidatus Hydrothermales bacterium]
MKKKSMLNYDLYFYTFLVIVLLRNFLESLLEEPHILFFSEDFYTSLIINIHFFFFYFTLLFIFLYLIIFITKRKIEEVLKILVNSFAVILIAPIFDFFVSGFKGYDLSYPLDPSLSFKDYFLNAINPFKYFPGSSPGMRLEIILAFFILIYYVKKFTGKILKGFVLYILIFLSILIFGLLPLSLIKIYPDFFKGGILPIDSQKYGTIYGFISFLFLLPFLLKEFNFIKTLKEDFSFFPIFLPLLGLLTGYKFFLKDFGTVHPFDYLLFLFLLCFSFLFYISKKIIISEVKSLNFIILTIVFYSTLFSFFHLFLTILLYFLYFLIKIYKNKIIIFLSFVFEKVLLFLFGYLFFSRENVFFLMDKGLILFLFLFFVFYFVFRSKLFKKNFVFEIFSFLIFVFILFFLLNFYFKIKVEDIISYRINYLLHLGKIKEADSLFKSSNVNKEKIEPLFFYHTKRFNDFEVMFDELYFKKEITKWAEVVSDWKKYFPLIENKKFLNPGLYFLFKFLKEGDIRFIFLAYRYGFDSYPVYDHLTDFFIKKNDFESALYIIEKTLAKNYSPLLEMKKYYIYFMLGNLKEAEKGLLSLKQRGFSNEILYNNLGVIYMNLGKFKEALFCFEKALEINPFYENTHENLKILKKMISKE